MFRRTIALLGAVIALGSCGESPTKRPDGQPSPAETSSELPAGDFSVCVFTYHSGDDAEPLQMIGPCSIPPDQALEKELKVAYVSEDGGTGTMLPLAFRGASAQRRQLITDREKAQALRTRLRELTAACEQDENGCLYR